MAATLLDCTTAAAAGDLRLNMSWGAIRKDGGVAALGLRSVSATLMAVGFLEAFSLHDPMGIRSTSEPSLIDFARHLPSCAPS
ncbi:hypothetical protein [Hoeflea sp.]|uniref:hypothetical protein n=1 Tax=Hoeflea sp. TaxID=1940281 RepID=UPI003BAE50DF